VIPNAATERWRRSNQLDASWARVIGQLSAPLGRIMPLGALGTVAMRQRAGLPFLTPALPLAGMPESAVDSTALYAGESASRLHEVVPAAQAVALLAA
jgi:nitronate monooxygenase